MVRTFFGNPGGKKNKLPIRRTPSVYVKPTIPNSTEIGRPVVEEGVHNEEEIQNGEELQNEKETDGGNRVNEEAIAELDSSSSVEGDDCENQMGDHSAYAILSSQIIWGDLMQRHHAWTARNETF
ncbi:hypothetical protein F2Q68_00031102 [Brassica cretica]|uniref:Uncharacterized protein n=1 Tax=Brassica cretica TaxID=69181 RepID=A0A8S9GCN1_BRACR|nr:hypothetical protein F2Q68_00031102 [Brassica cretica]